MRACARAAHLFGEYTAAPAGFTAAHPPASRRRTSRLTAARPPAYTAASAGFTAARPPAHGGQPLAQPRARSDARPARPLGAPTGGVLGAQPAKGLNACGTYAAK